MNHYFDLVHEERDFLIVQKYPGISFHKQPEELGLFQQIQAQWPAQKLYPVHRLDRITSGLLVLAKTKDCAREFLHLFRSGQVQKYYLAISAHKPKKKQGMVKGDMIRGRRGSWMLSASQENPAITAFFSKGMGNGLRLFLLKPRTGKTHQLRVMLKSLGAPLLGDPLYRKAVNVSNSQIQNPDRAYLHAFQLEFVLQQTSYRFQVMPNAGFWFQSEAFAAAVEEYRHPEQMEWPKKSDR